MTNLVHDAELLSKLNLIENGQRAIIFAEAMLKTVSDTIERRRNATAMTNSADNALSDITSGITDILSDLSAAGIALDEEREAFLLETGAIEP